MRIAFAAAFVLDSVRKQNKRATIVTMQLYRNYVMIFVSPSHFKLDFKTILEIGIQFGDLNKVSYSQVIDVGDSLSHWQRRARTPSEKRGTASL